MGDKEHQQSDCHGSPVDALVARREILIALSINSRFKAGGTVGTGYKKSSATKERVLKAAYEQFSTYGYHGASLREIAALCGISHPGIRHHFPTKEDLFIEVLRERDSRVRSSVETWITEKGVSIEGVVEIACQNMTTPGILELFTITAAQGGSPDRPAHDFVVMTYAERRRLYAKYPRIGQEQATVRRNIDLEDTASTDNGGALGRHWHPVDDGPGGSLLGERARKGFRGDLCLPKRSEQICSTQESRLTRDIG